MRFLTLLHKIFKGQSLKTGPKMYTMAKNILSGEALRVEKKNNKNLTEIRPKRTIGWSLRV